MVWKGPDQRQTIGGGCADACSGGNLSLLAALCGSDYLPGFKNKLVFIEDVGEKPYRIDRMLTQLLQSTDLSKAAGILLGQFNHCEAQPGENSLTLLQTLQDRLRGLRIPVLYGMPFGHIDDMATFPVGLKARIDTEQQSLVFLEKGSL